MRRLILLSALIASAASADVPKSGSWDGVVHVNEADVPFRFELRVQDARAEGAFFNGDERVRSAAASAMGSSCSVTSRAHGPPCSRSRRGPTAR